MLGACVTGGYVDAIRSLPSARVITILPRLWRHSGDGVRIGLETERARTLVVVVLLRWTAADGKSAHDLRAMALASDLTRWIPSHQEGLKRWRAIASQSA